MPEKVKYLGWALNDQDPGVRKASIESLHACYSLWSDSPTLLVFHQKFSRRILELTRDIDSTVVAASLDLITAILT